MLVRSLAAAAIRRFYAPRRADHDFFSAQASRETSCGIFVRMTPYSQADERLASDAPLSGDLWLLGRGSFLPVFYEASGASACSLPLGFRCRNYFVPSHEILTGRWWDRPGQDFVGSEDQPATVGPRERKSAGCGAMDIASIGPAQELPPLLLEWRRFRFPRLCGISAESSAVAWRPCAPCERCQGRWLKRFLRYLSSFDRPSLRLASASPDDSLKDHRHTHAGANHLSSWWLVLAWRPASRPCFLGIFYLTARIFNLTSYDTTSGNFCQECVMIILCF